MAAIEQATLFYSSGSSDKVYTVELVEVEGGNVVNFRHGKRGSTLRVGTKTAAPVDLVQARNIFTRLVKSKMSDGYTPDVSGVAYQGTENAGLVSGFLPQLLNPVTEAEALFLLSDPKWAAQAKMDGERRASMAGNGSVIGANRKGLIVPLPQHIADELLAIASATGAIHVDGELIGECLHVFDLHSYKGQCIRSRPWIARMNLALSALAACKHIKAVPVAVSATEKRDLWDSVLRSNGEGVVFKLLDCVVEPGRPNSAGSWLKYKFKATASCFVLGTNAGKRSVNIGLLDAATNLLVSSGNVTIPPSQPIPSAHSIVEVEYLYASKAGILFQPVFLGLRTDLDPCNCTTAQLKYKPDDVEGRA